MDAADWDTPTEFVYYIPERPLFMLLLSNSKELLEAKSTVEGVKPYAKLRSLCSTINDATIRKVITEKALIQGFSSIVPVLPNLSKEDLCDLYFLLESKSLGTISIENECKVLTLNNCDLSYSVRKDVISYGRILTLNETPFAGLFKLSELKSSKMELDEVALLDGRDVIKGDKFAIVGLSNDTNIYGSQALAYAFSLDFLIVVPTPQKKLRAFLKLISRDFAVGDVQELRRSISLTLKVNGKKLVNVTRSNLYDELRNYKFEILDLSSTDMRSVIKVSDRTLLVGSGNDNSVRALKDAGYDIIFSRNKIMEDYIIPIFSTTNK